MGTTYDPCRTTRPLLAQASGLALIYATDKVSLSISHLRGGSTAWPHNLGSFPKGPLRALTLAPAALCSPGSHILSHIYGKTVVPLQGAMLSLDASAR